MVVSVCYRLAVGIHVPGLPETMARKEPRKSKNEGLIVKEEWERCYCANHS